MSIFNNIFNYFSSCFNSEEQDGLLLHTAIKENNLGQVEALLDRGANPESRDRYGWTPLHEAAFRGNREAVNLLLQHCVDVNAEDKYGQTPLFVAVYNGYEDVCGLLFQHGADPFDKDQYGSTPFTANPGLITSLLSTKYLSKLRLFSS